MSDKEWDVLQDFQKILAVRCINPGIRRQQLILLIGPQYGPAVYVGEENTHLVKCHPLLRDVYDEMEAPRLGLPPLIEVDISWY
jgi:hypothetical protein